VREGGREGGREGTYRRDRSRCRRSWAIEAGGCEGLAREEEGREGRREGGKARTGVTVVGAVDLGPLRPRVVGGPLVGGLGHELEIDDGLAPVSHGGADAVRAWKGGRKGGREGGREG